MEYGERIDELARRAERDRTAFDPPADPPDPERAMEFLREGFGQAVGLYVQARAGDGQVRFSHREFDRLERAMNDWLALYAACYGVDYQPEFTVREAAELLVRTHDIGDVAQLLTKVPERGDAASAPGETPPG
ncbi:hypothetical protein [Halorarius halobius]|uniref:hypothetical protein n=1 Tax=Halorarius halobius TaxID=2962671 RepID=UPI0020CE5819|nr:hypothetical protein [Halorarius halobius]